jgi:transcriptional regulator with XRE-family HTH domain
MADVARADRFRALRAEHRLTQPEMADIAGVSLRAYQAWESLKKPGGIEFEHAEAVGRRFNVDPEMLVRRRGDTPITVDPDELQAQLDRIENMLASVVDALGIDQDADVHPLEQINQIAAALPGLLATDDETAATTETRPAGS